MFYIKHKLVKFVLLNRNQIMETRSLKTGLIDTQINTASNLISDDQLTKPTSVLICLKYQAQIDNQLKIRVNS